MRRFFCFFLNAARLRAVFLRFFSRMAVSYRLGALGVGGCPSIITAHAKAHNRPIRSRALSGFRPCLCRRTPDRPRL